MKKKFFILLALILALSFACTPSEKKTDVPPPPTVPEEQAAPAPREPESAREVVEGYRKGLVTSMDKARGAQAKVDMEEVKAAVQNYHIDNGVYPSSLEDISDSLSPGVDLSLYSYNPNTGAVGLK